MAKKTLLSEAQVRKFMKLAAIGPLSENFLAEEETDEEVMNEADEADGDMPAPADDDMDDMSAGDDMDDDMPAGGMDAGKAEGEDAIKDALMALIDAIKGAPDAEITIDDTDGDMGDGDPLDEGEDYMSDDDPLGEGYMEEELYEELNESVQVVDTQAVVKEVSRRVAQRLIKESKQEQLAEALAARIAARLN